MVLNFDDSKDLLQNAEVQQLYGKLVAQLEKDFSLANVHVDLFQGISPNDLVTVLREKVYYLIMERFSEYLNLLYIIDVPEKAFKEIKVTDAVEVADQVSFLVLKRELQKVWLKAKYS
ncbi:hypothetical protein SAMN05421766_104131 [Zobellia uliginosa]|uniref:Uncharacterized protein n=1 Tax=Zobellia uliginosa TaxID=143224 RepID=A0ABY1KVF7_9FLAO|nr:hypothetical protein [Zobellia uliginosa]MDO6517421.1 hypothetical protein [Zobellia uliginosa]SIS81770.1 hypothetical protein SAMN05421766_104131 [Zobellia uliginosa]